MSDDEATFNEAAIKAQKTMQKTKITKTKTFVDSFDKEVSDFQELTVRRKHLQDAYKEFERLVYLLIEYHNADQAKMETIQEELSEVDERVVSIEARIIRIIAEYRQSHPEYRDDEFSHTGEHGSKPLGIKLPKIKLPDFDGSYTNWVTFRDTFTALVHSSTQIDNIVKFTHLLGALKDDVKKSLGPVTLSELGYNNYWKNLQAKYDNERKIVEAYIEAVWSVPIVQKGSASDLERLITAVKTSTQSLAMLGYETDKLSEQFFMLSITKKLDHQLRIDWEDENPIYQLPKLESLIKFLERRAHALKAISSNSAQASSATNNQKTKQSFKPQIPVKSMIITRTTDNQNKSIHCILCNSTSHFIYKCNQYLSLPVGERYRKLIELKACLNCMRQSHQVRDCTSNISCRSCLQRHHTSLHNNEFKPSNVTYGTSVQQENYNQCYQASNGSEELSSKQKISNQCYQASKDKRTQFQRHPFYQCYQTGGDGKQHLLSPQSSEVLSTASKPKSKSVQQSSLNYQATIKPSSSSKDSHPDREVLLSTARVLIKTRQGRFIECRAMLDSGSQSNFISEDLAQRLGHEIINSPMPVTGLGDMKTKADRKINAEVRSQTSQFQMKLQLRLIPFVTNRLPSIAIDISRWNIPPFMRMADPGFNTPSKIDILLGVDVFFRSLQNESIVIHHQLPPLRQTKFGWIIGGEVDSLQNKAQNNANFCGHLTSTYEAEDNIQLNKNLQKFWKLESVPSSSRWSPEETEAEKHFMETFTRDSTGRFTVRMPVKANFNQLQDSREIAMKQFYYLERKLEASPEMKQQYHDVINEYIQLGHMRKIEDFNNDEITFTLPHHAVMKPASTTTSCRVVFNAGIEGPSGLSLNDVCMVGPYIQQNLIDIMLRCRKYQYMFTTDIAKMYRQINMHQSDTKLQRVLWRESSKQPLETFELTTVTFGTSSAPFLATRTLAQLATEESSSFPLGSQVILADPYMDDIISGADTIEMAQEKIRQMIRITERGKFHLRKWCSNAPEVLQNIPEIDRNTITSEGVEAIKTLGILWDPSEDTFFFDIRSTTSSDTITKRTILSAIAKIFDPFGFLAPTMMCAKILLQTLWTLDLNWDDEIPSDVQQEWSEFSNTIKHLNDIRILRHATVNHAKSIQLHGFADGSRKAYGACVYIRTVNQEGEVKSQLLCSKSRVSPIKTITTNRLELCAALLLSTLINVVINAMDILFEKVILWTDSTITLQWINTSPHRLQTFEANRVAEIQRLTESFIWNHVRTHENPADPLSRGVKPSQLKELSLWWHGPSFLLQTEEDWPQWISSVSCNELPGLRSITKHVMVTTSEPPFDLLQRYSSYIKLLRITAWCQRFIRNSRNKTDKSIGKNYEQSLSVEELESSKFIIIKLIQKSYFQQEMKNLQNNSDKVTTNSSIKCLNPFLDRHGIIRVGGRLQNATHLPYNARHQILMPYDHTISFLIMLDFHYSNYHAGPSLTLASSRSEFWFIKGLKLARKVYRQCVTCCKYKPIMMEQLMANYPQERVTPSRAFKITGVDLCGYFFIKNKNQRKGTPIKCYVVSFICFSTKAVYLTIVLDQSTDSFLAAFKRFISQRGKPSIMWSDHGSNFEGARNKLKDHYEQYMEEISSKPFNDFLVKKGIKWNHIPPYTPNFGGLWESSIKSFKHHFKRIVRNEILTYEEMTTLVTEIEGILNSRPLWPQSNNPNDPEPLTPFHFLTGGPFEPIQEPDLNDIPSNRLTRWENVTKMVQSFWKRYATEYLHTLQQRYKWQEQKENIRVGELVFIKDDNISLGRWLMGRVYQVDLKNDGNVHMVHIKTQNGTTKRGISKLCKLPIDCEN